MKIHIRRALNRKLSITVSIAVFLIILIAWWFITRMGLVKPYFLASPGQVITAFQKLLSENLIRDLGYSLFRISLGFLSSTVLGLLFGIGIGCFRPFESIFSPLFSFIRYLPVPALIPFFILWFGVGEMEKIIVVFVGVFFQLVFMIADSVRKVPDELLNISYTLGTRNINTITKVILPYSSPRIFDNLRVSFGWAWGWVMLSELVGANSGIGYMILRSQRFLINENMIVGLILLGLLGITTDQLFLLSEKRLFKWQE